MKAHYYTNLVEGGSSIQGDALIKKNALNEVVRQFKLGIKVSLGIVNLALDHELTYQGNQSYQPYQSYQGYQGYQGCKIENAALNKSANNNKLTFKL